MKRETLILLLILFSIFPVSIALSYSSNTVQSSFEWDSGGVITVNGTQSVGFTLYYDPSGVNTMLSSQVITDGLSEVTYADLENGEYELGLGWSILDIYGLEDPSDDRSGSESIFFTIDDNSTASVVKTIVKPDPPILTEYERAYSES